jgi:hypothetical protein
LQAGVLLLLKKPGLKNKKRGIPIMNTQLKKWLLLFRVIIAGILIESGLPVRGADWYVTIDAPKKMEAEIGSEGNSWDTPVRLWEAIAVAKSGDKIYLEGGIIQETENIPGNLPDGFSYYVIKNKTLTIEGGFRRSTSDKAGSTTIKPPTGGRIMFILKSTVSITGVCFEGGNAVKDRSSSSLTIDGFSVKPYAGGALYAAESDLTLTDIQFIGNKGHVGTPLAINPPVPVQGGGLFVEGGKVTIRGTTVVKDNEANKGDAGVGGGMAFLSAKVVFEGTLKFENNVATRDGSASDDTPIPMGGAIYYENGEGVYDPSRTMSFEGATSLTFENNIAGVDTKKGFGGAIATVASDFTLSGARFTGNCGNKGGELGYGGAIAVCSNEPSSAPLRLVLEGVEFKDNIALDMVTGTGTGYGGAIYAQFCDVIAWKKTLIENNIASTGKGEAKGGAIYLAAGALNEPKLGLLDESVIRHNYGTKNPDASAFPYVGGGVYAEFLKELVLYGDYTSEGLVPWAVPAKVEAPRIYDNFPSINPDKCGQPTIRNVYPHHEKMRTAYLHVGNTPAASSGYRFEPEDYIDVTFGTLTRFACILPSNLPDGVQPEVFVAPLESSPNDPMQLPEVLIPQESDSEGKLFYEYRLTKDVEIYLNGVSMLRFDDLDKAVAYEEDVMPGPLHAGFPGLEQAFAVPYSDELYFTMQIKDADYSQVSSRISIMEGSTLRQELKPYHREAGVHYYKYTPLPLKNVTLKPHLEYFIFHLPPTKDLTDAGLALPSPEKLGNFIQPEGNKNYCLSEGQSFTFYVKEINTEAWLNDATLPELTFSGLNGEKVKAVKVGNNLYRFTVKVPEVINLPFGTPVSFQFIRAKRSELNVQVGYGYLANNFAGEMMNFENTFGVPKDGILTQTGWYYYEPLLSGYHDLGLRVKADNVFPGVDESLVPRVTLDNRVLNYTDVNDPQNLFKGLSPSMLLGLYTYYFQYYDNAKIEDCTGEVWEETQPLSATLCVGKVNNYHVYFPELPKHTFPLSLLFYDFEPIENKSASPPTTGAKVKTGVNLLKNDTTWSLPFSLKWDTKFAHKLRPMVTHMALTEDVNKKVQVVPHQTSDDGLKYEIKVSNDEGQRDAVIGVSLDVAEIDYPKLPWGVKYQEKDLSERPAGIHYFGALTDQEAWIDTFIIQLPGHIKVDPKVTIATKDSPGAVACVELIDDPEFTDRSEGMYCYRVRLTGKNVAAGLSVVFEAEHIITFPYRKEMPEGIQYGYENEQGGPHYLGNEKGITIPLIMNSRRVGYTKAVFKPADDPNETPVEISIDYLNPEKTVATITINAEAIRTGTISFVPESYKVILSPMPVAGLTVAEKSGIKVGENIYSINHQISDWLVLTLAPNYIGFTPEVKKSTAVSGSTVETVVLDHHEGNTYYYKIEGEANLWLEVFLSEQPNKVELSKFGMPEKVCYSDARLEGDYHVRNGNAFEFIVNIQLGDMAIPLPMAYDVSKGSWEEYQYQPEMERYLGVAKNGNSYYHSYRYKVDRVSTDIIIVVPRKATGTLVLPSLPEGLQYEAGEGYLSGGRTYRLTDQINGKVAIGIRPTHDLEIPCFEWRMKPSELDTAKYFSIVSGMEGDARLFQIEGSFWGKKGRVTHTWKTVATELELAADEAYYRVELPARPQDDSQDMLAYAGNLQATKTYRYNQAGEFILDVNLLTPYKEASVTLWNTVGEGEEEIAGVRRVDSDNNVTYSYTFKGKSFLNLSRFEVSFKKVKLPVLPKGFQYVEVPRQSTGGGDRDYYFTREEASERILSTDTTGVWFGLRANLVPNNTIWPDVKGNDNKIDPVSSRNDKVKYYYVDLTEYSEPVTVTVESDGYHCVTLPVLEQEEVVVYHAGEDASVSSAGKYIVTGRTNFTFYLQLQEPYLKAALTVGEEELSGNTEDGIYCYTINNISKDTTVKIEVSYHTLTLTAIEDLPHGMEYATEVPLTYYSAASWNVSFGIRVDDDYKGVDPIVRFADGTQGITVTKEGELLYKYTVTGSGDKRVQIGWEVVSITLPPVNGKFRYRNIDPLTYPNNHTKEAEICWTVEPVGIYSEGVPFIIMEEGKQPQCGVKIGWSNHYEIKFKADKGYTPEIDVWCSELNLPLSANLPEGLTYEAFEGEGGFKTIRYHHPENEWADSFKVKTKVGYEGIPPVVYTAGSEVPSSRIEDGNTYVYKFTNSGDLTLYIDHPFYRVTLPEETDLFSYIERPPLTMRYSPEATLSFSIRVADAYSGSEPVVIIDGAPKYGTQITENDYLFKFDVTEEIHVTAIMLQNSTLVLPDADKLPDGLSYAPVDALKLTRYHPDRNTWVDSFRIYREPLYSHIIPKFSVQCENGVDVIVQCDREDGEYLVYKVYGKGNVWVELPYEACAVDFPAAHPDTFAYVGEASEGTRLYHRDWEVKFSVKSSGKYEESEPVAVIHGEEIRRKRGVPEEEGVYTFSFKPDDTHTVLKIEPLYVTFTLPEELPIGLSYAGGDAANPVRRHKPDVPWTERFTLEMAPEYREMSPVVKNNGEVITYNAKGDDYYIYEVSAIGNSSLEISLPCITVRLPATLPDELEYLAKDAGDLLRIYSAATEWTESFSLRVKDGRYNHIVPLVRTSKGDILTGAQSGNAYHYTFEGQEDVFLLIDFPYHTVTLPPADPNLFAYTGSYGAGVHVLQAGESLTISMQPRGAYTGFDLMAVLNSQDVIQGKKRTGSDIYDITFTVREDYIVQIYPYYYTLILPQTLPNGLGYDPRYRQGGSYYSSTTKLFCDTFAIEVKDEMLREVIPQAFLTIDGVVTDSLLKPYKREGMVHFYSLRFMGNASVRVEMNYWACAFMLPKTLPQGVKYASGSKGAGTYTHFISTSYRDTFILETEEDFAIFRPIVTVGEREITPYLRAGRRFYYAVEAENSVLVDIKMSYFQLSLPLPSALPVGLAYAEEPESYLRFCTKGEIVNLTLDILSPYDYCIPLVHLGTQTLTPEKLSSSRYRYTIKTADAEGLSADVTIEMDGIQVTLPSLPPFLSYVSSQGLSEGVYYMQPGIENTFVISKKAGYEVGVITVMLDGQVLEGVPLDEAGKNMKYSFTTRKKGADLKFQVSFGYYAVEFPNTLPEGLSLSPLSTLKGSKIYKPEPTEELLVIGAPIHGVIPTVKLEGGAGTEKIEPYLTEMTGSQQLFHYRIPISSSFAVRIGITSCVLVLPELPEGLAYVDGYPGAGDHEYLEGSTFTFRVRMLPPYEEAEPTATYIKDGVPMALYRARVDGTIFAFSGMMNMEIIAPEIVFHYTRFTLPELPAGLSYRSDSKSGGNYYHAPDEVLIDSFVLVLDEDKINLVPIVTATAGELNLTYEPPYVYKYKLISLVDATVSVSLPRYTVKLPELPEEQLSYTGDVAAGEHVLGYGKELSFSLEMSDTYASAIPYVRIFGETYQGTQGDNSGLYKFSIPVYGSDVSEIKVKYLSLTLPEAPEGVVYLPKLKQQGVYFYAPDKTFRDSFALQPVEQYRNAKLQVLCNGQPLNPYRSEGKVCYYCIESGVNAQVNISLLCETFLLTLPELPAGLSYTGVFTEAGVHEVYGATSFTDTLSLQTDPDYSFVTPKVLRGTDILPVFSEKVLSEGGKLFRYVVTGTGNVTLSVDFSYYTLVLPSLSGISGALGYVEGRPGAGTYKVSPGIPFDFSIQVADPLYVNVSPLAQRVTGSEVPVTLAAISASGTTYNYRCVYNAQTTVQVKVSMPHDTLFLPAKNTLPEGVSYAPGSIAAGIHFYTRGKIASFSLSVANDVYVLPLVTVNGNLMPYGQTGSRVYRFEFPVERYIAPQIGTQPFIVLTLPPDLPTGVMYAANSKAGGKYYHLPNVNFRDTFALTVQERFSEVVPLVSVDGGVELQPYIREGNTYRYAVTGNRDMEIFVAFEYYTVTVPEPPSGVSFAETSPIKSGLYYRQKGRNTTDEIILQLRDDLNPGKLVLTFNGHLPCQISESTGNTFVYRISSSANRVYNIYYDYRCIILPELPSGLTYASGESSSEIIKAGVYYFSNQQSEPFTFRIVITDVLVQQGRLPVVGIGVETILPTIITNSLYEYTINSSIEADLYVKISLLGDPPPNEPPPPTSIKEFLPEAAILPSVQYVDGELTFGYLAGYRFSLTAADGRHLRLFLIGSEFELYRLSLPPGVYILVGQKGGSSTFKRKFVIR